MDGGITEIFPGITQPGMQSPVQALFQPASLRRLHQTEWIPARVSSTSTILCEASSSSIPRWRASPIPTPQPPLRLTTI